MPKAFSQGIYLPTGSFAVYRYSIPISKSREGIRFFSSMRYSYAMTRVVL